MGCPASPVAILLFLGALLLLECTQVAEARWNRGPLKPPAAITLPNRTPLQQHERDHPDLQGSLRARELLEKYPLFARRSRDAEPLYCYHCKGEFKCKNEPKLKICEKPYRTCQTIYADEAKSIVVAKDCGYDYGCAVPSDGEVALYPNAYVKCHCFTSFCNWYPRANIGEGTSDPATHSAEKAGIDPW